MEKLIKLKRMLNQTSKNQNYIELSIQSFLLKSHEVQKQCSEFSSEHIKSEAVKPKYTHVTHRLVLFVREKIKIIYVVPCSEKHKR